MIRRKVSAAFLLRDGFTGQTIAGGSGIRCSIDGRPLFRPVWKKDGYLVLMDLEPGEHELVIKRSGYRDETVALSIKEDAMLEDSISLKPGVGYRFPSDTVRVTLSLKRGKVFSSGAQLWLGIQPRIRLVIAQELAKAGENSVRLFCGGSASLLPIPGHFLLMDSSAPELLYLRSLRSENGEFSSPLEAEHARGTELIPMQSYLADAEGTVRILLPEPGKLIGCFGGRVFEAQLSAGEQSLIWNLEE